MSAKCLVTDSPDYQKAHLQCLSFPSVALVWSKTVSCRLCARQSKGTLKARKNAAYWTWRYKIPDFFHDSTRPHLHFAAEIAAIRGLYIGLRLRYKYYKKHSHSGLAWSRPRADRGLSRPTSVFRTTIGVCKIFPVRLIFGSTKAKTCFRVKSLSNGVNSTSKAPRPMCTAVHQV